MKYFVGCLIGGEAREIFSSGESHMVIGVSFRKLLSTTNTFWSIGANI